MARHVPSERLFLREGPQVEIFYKDNGIEGVWYKAIIETKPLSGGELYVRFCKSGFPIPLDELEGNDNVLIRTIPPKNVLDHIEINIGTIVDADYEDAWWTGFVVKQIGANKCLVFFDSLSDIIQFERKHLRPHLHWGDEKMYSWWAFVSTQNSEFLWRLATEPMFCPGKMVEVSSKKNEAEVVWVSAMFIKKFKEGDEYKCIVKVCDKSLSFKSNEARPNKTVDLRSLRPTPPSILVKEYQLDEYVEVFHDGMGWRQGRVMGSQGRVRGTPFEKWYVVRFEATKKQLGFKQSDLRPLKVWEDGIWKTYTQGSGDKTGDYVMNANEFDPPLTPPPGITTTLLKQIEAENQRKKLPKKTRSRNQNCSGNKSTQKNTMESPLTQGSGDKMSNSVMNAKAPVTPSPGITETLLKQTEAETQRKTFPKKKLPRNQNGSGKDSTRENEKSEDITRKRKRDENLCSDASVKDSKAKDTTMTLPFEKKLRIWKTLESTEVFKTVPQSPHFSPLAKTKEDLREVLAVGMMLTYSGLLEEIKALQLDDSIRSLRSLSNSFAELEKHGFNVKVPQLRIIKLLSLRDRQAKKMVELQGAESVTAEKESIKVENERKIIELQRLNKEVDKEIDRSKSCAAKIVQQLNDVELQFVTTTSAPW